MILYDSPGIESGLNIHLEEPVSTKTDLKNLTKPTSHETAEIAKTLITDTNVKMQKDDVMNLDRWSSTSTLISIRKHKMEI